MSLGSADDFFRKVIDEILENLLLFWRFGSFDNYPQKNSKISSKKMKKSCFGSAIFLSKCSSLDLQWGQMGRGFSADDFFCQKSSLLRRSVRGHYVTWSFHCTCVTFLCTVRPFRLLFMIFYWNVIDFDSIFAVFPLCLFVLFVMLVFNSNFLCKFI